MAHQLVVVSFDSLQSNDLDVLAEMPFFSQILRGGAVVQNIRPIYPTLTYPIHTTMISGVRPQVHGIVHNQIPGLWRQNPDWSLYGSDWYWYRKDVQVPTLLDAAAAAGKKVASVLWPVTAGEKGFLNVPPIWPDRTQDPRALMQHAMSEEAYARFYHRYHAHYHWENVDDMHYYGAEIALESLEEDRAERLLRHVEQLDDTRHHYGDSGREVHLCLRQLDILAGRYLAAAQRAGTLEQTNFVFLGDHGQIDVEHVFLLNRLFVEEGLIQLDEAGEPADYLAYGFSAGFSSEIFLKHPDDPALRQRVHTFLQNVQQRYPQYIERVYTAQELAEQEGLAKEGLCFMVEGTRGTFLEKKLHGPLISSAEGSNKQYHATHGHHPDKLPQPPLIAFGPDIQPGVTIAQGDILSIAPTLASLLDIPFPQAEGQVLPIQKKSN